MLKIAAIMVIAVVLIGLLFVLQQKSRPLIVSGFVDETLFRKSVERTAKRREPS